MSAKELDRALRKLRQPRKIRVCVVGEAPKTITYRPGRLLEWLNEFAEERPEETP